MSDSAIELQEKQAGSRFYTESLTTMLMVHLLRNYSAVKPKIPDYRGGLAKYKLRIAIAFINENLDRDLRLAQIASLVAMSPYHFARMFKQSTGLTPHQYLVQQRLIKAKELLRYSEMAIADIGYTVGYKNPSHFGEVAGILKPDAIANTARQDLGGFQATQHVITNHLIELSGNNATCKAHVRAMHFLPNDNLESMLEIGGYYDAGLIEIESNWKIKSWKFMILWSKGDLKLFDLVKKQQANC